MWKHKNFINLQLCAGETWLLNETLDSTKLAKTAVDFVSNNIQYKYIERGGTFSSPYLDYYTSNDYVEVYTVESPNFPTSYWIDQAYRTITFAEPVTDSTLLTWLQANGTKQSTPQPTLTFKHFFDAGTIGTGTIKFRHYSQQEPISGETWVINEEPHYSPLSSSLDEQISFESNGETFSRISLSSELVPMHNDAVSIYYGYGDNVYYSGSWQNTAYRTITFAEPVTDSTLLAWLQANGTKQGGGGAVTLIKAGTYKWNAILPKPSQSFDQELVAKVYDLQTDGVRATKMPEANIEYISFTVGAENEISEMQELGDTTIKATFGLDSWNTEQYNGYGNQNLQIIVFENDQQVSQEFYDYAITDGNLQALTNWTPHSYFSYHVNDEYDVTVNGKIESLGYELKQGDIIRVAASGSIHHTVYFATISDSSAMSKNSAYTVVDEDIHLYIDKYSVDSTGATITYQAN